MANATLAEYISWFKGYLQADRDSEDQVYPDVDIIGFLNRAQLDVARDLGFSNNFFRGTNTRDLETGSLTLPEDFLGNLKIQVSDSTNIRRALFINQADRMDEMFPYWRSTPATNYPTWAVIEWGSTGVTYQVWPQPIATVTNGLFESYTKLPTDMENDADESEVMLMFPELQRTMLPFGALRHALLFEGGEADDQVQKFEALYQNDLARARFAINSMFPQSYKYGMTL